MLEGCQITSIVIFTETNHHFGKDGLTGNKIKYDLWYPIIILLTEFTFPKTNSSPLKKRSSKRKVVFQTLIFRGDLLVSGEGTTSKKHQQIPKLPESRHSPGLAWPQIQCNYAMEWRNETGIAYKNLCPNNYLKFDHLQFYKNCLDAKTRWWFCSQGPLLKVEAWFFVGALSQFQQTCGRRRFGMQHLRLPAMSKSFWASSAMAFTSSACLRDNHLSRKRMQRGDVPSINSEIGSIRTVPTDLQTSPGLELIKMDDNTSYARNLCKLQMLTGPVDHPYKSYFNIRWKLPSQVCLRMGTES